MHIQDYIEKSNIVVLKIGSALVTDDTMGSVHRNWLATLLEDIAHFTRQGKKICIVCSGAVALGRNILHESAILAQDMKRASAACGQILLMQAWQEAAARHGLQIGQLLLTMYDSESRQRYLNASTTLRLLLEKNIIPIVNENDTVASTESKVGDNDRLAARTAQMIGADMLWLLSDIDGLYSADPSVHNDAEFIPHVPQLTEHIRNFAGAPQSAVGTGGMATKLLAVDIASHSGCHTIISRGTQPHPLRALIESGRGTIFTSSTTPLGARKEWISGALASGSKIVIDDGAAKALQAGNSLLPIGVRASYGEFQAGDAVRICDSDGIVQALGITRYNRLELSRIAGKHSDAIYDILGYERGAVIVHRNDMVMQG